MSEAVHNITDLPRKASTPVKVAKWSAVGLLAFGALLLIDDKVKKIFPGKTENENTEA